MNRVIAVIRESQILPWPIDDTPTELAPLMGVDDAFWELSHTMKIALRESVG